MLVGRCCAIDAPMLLSAVMLATCIAAALSLSAYSSLPACCSAMCMDVQASSYQRYDEEASQPLQGSADSHAYTALLPAPPHVPQLSHPCVAGTMQDANAGVLQNHVDGNRVQAALSDAAVESHQQQTSASNDGLRLEDSSDQQHAAASVNAHGTVVEQEMPISDAETDLSSIGLRHSAQGDNRHACNPAFTKNSRHTCGCLHHISLPKP